MENGATSALTNKMALLYAGSWKMKKYHCLFVLEEARLGGPQIYIINLLSILKSSCEYSFVFPERASERTKEMCVANGLAFETLPLRTLSIKFSAMLMYLLTFLPDIVRIMKFIKSRNPDIVYLAGGSWQFKSAIATFLSGYPFAWHLNDTQMHPLILSIFGIVSKTARSFVYASRRTQMYYQKYIVPEREGMVIPSSVSNVFFEIPREYEKQNETGLKVVTVANINPVKGFEKLIEIARISKMRNSKLQFYIVGEVFSTQLDYFEILQQRIAKYGLDNIHWLGARDHVETLLRDMDVYLCTSESESSPISVWEAMASGLPIVATDVGDVRYYLEKHKAGFIHSSAEQAHDSLQRFFEDPKLLETRGVAAVHCAEQNFSANKCAELHLKFFQSISKDT